MTDEAAARALRAAVDAYDRARVFAHGHGDDMARHGMSERNKASIAPMILAAVEAYAAALPEPAAPAAPGAEALHGPTIEACANLAFEAWLEGIPDAEVGKYIRDNAAALATPPARAEPTP